MNERWWERLVSQKVAVLATVTSEGRPHLVPFTFVCLPGRRLVSAVDAKPKSTRRLRRLDNIRRDSRVTVLAHGYHDDWSRLWWVRAEGRAEVLDDPPGDARAMMLERYPQYGSQQLGPWMVIDLDTITGWSAER